MLHGCQVHLFIYVLPVMIFTLKPVDTLFAFGFVPYETRVDWRRCIQCQLSSIFLCVEHLSLQLLLKQTFGEDITHV